MSIYKNWVILKRKLGPLDTNEIEPLQQHVGRLIQESVLTESEIVKALIWTTMNCEEFYYQNTSLLIVNHLYDLDTMCTLLNDHRNVIRWETRLHKFKLLGEGSFGKVFKAKDKKTKRRVAVKEIKPPKTENLRNLYFYLMDVLKERNTLSELNKCSLFVKLIAAFHTEDNNGYRIITELCIADLSDFILLYDEDSSIDEIKKSYELYERMDEVYKRMSVRLHSDYHKLIYTYFFEMLCALYYLGTKHVLHADIKPENILISELGHIKLADFGLSLRNQWYESPYLSLLEFDVKKLNYNSKQFNERSTCGTKVYYDPELIISDLRKKTEMKKRLNNLLKSNEYFKNLKDFKQNFLSDLYAVGLVMFEMVFAFPIQYDDFALDHSSFWSIELIYNNKMRENELVEPLMNMAKRNNESLSIIALLLTIFLPREIRCENYVSTVSIYKNGEIKKEKFIDINKIENVFYYKTKNMTSESVGQISLTNKAFYIKKKIALDKKKASKTTKTKSIEKSETIGEGMFFRLHPLDFTAD